ncbi:minor tail protein [Microbacterium phage Zepp]|nr:minor tail protein [Microbacterium phage Zepp]QWY84466.1 hypothetical protein SEA_QUADZERO_21 [Microbacterium phage QuadZero]
MTIQDIRDITSFKWATIKTVDPLSIQLDGDTAPLALIPDSLIDPLLLKVNDRVRVELSLRKVVIHGKSNGVAPKEQGKVLLRPTSVVGATVNAANEIIPNSSATSVSVNGVFSEKYRAYEIEAWFHSAAAGAIPTFRYRSAGADQTAASAYSSEYYGMNGTSMAASQQSESSFSLPVIGATFHKLWMSIINPYTLGTETVADFRMDSFLNGTGQRQGFFYYSGGGAINMDGFTFLYAAGSYHATQRSWIKVYGIV